MRALIDYFDQLSWHLKPATPQSNADEVWTLRDPLTGLSRGFARLRDVWLWWRRINLERARAECRLATVRAMVTSADEETLSDLKRYFSFVRGTSMRPLTGHAYLALAQAEDVVRAVRLPSDWPRRAQAKVWDFSSPLGPNFLIEVEHALNL